MEILPAIDLMSGQAVRLVQGRRADKTVVGDPETLVREFADAGATRVHVVDLDGAFAGAPRHLALITRLARHLPVQLGGGIRTADDIRTATEAGADRLIIGTAAVADPELLSLVPPASLVVGVDVKDGRVALRGWEEVAEWTPRDFVAHLAEQGVRRILCTAVHRDGTLAGPDLEVLGEVGWPGMAVIASGGVGQISDLHALSRIPGVEAAVVGKALYSGAFTLAEARAALC